MVNQQAEKKKADPKEDEAKAAAAKAGIPKRISPHHFATRTPAISCSPTMTCRPSSDSSGTVTRVSLKDAVEGFERDLIQDALKTTRGNRAKAARLLDTTERILNYKVRNLGVDVRRFRPSDAGRRAAVRRADSEQPLEAEQAAAE